MTNIEDGSAEHAAHSSGDVRANSGGAFANLTHLPHLPHLTGKDSLGSELHPTSSNAPPEPATVDEPLIDSSAAAPAEPAPSLHRLVEEIVMAPGWREALRAAVAAADRENAELRGEVERLHRRLFPSQGENYANEVERQRVVIDTMRDAIASRTAERDDLRAQLAAAERDRDEARSERDDAGLLWGRHYNDAMGALETQLAAAQAQLAEARAWLALVRRWESCGESTGIASNRCMLPPGHVGAHDCQLVPGSVAYFAALTAAPQPEPVQCDTCDGTGVIEEQHEIGAPGTGGWISCPDCGPTPSVACLPPASAEPTGRSD